ncbi:MAG: pseudouridine synthase [Alphaproteobacteria bacterium]
MTLARISKWLSQAGLCSRREAERWIADGRVKVDGAVITSPGTQVEDASRILVDDRPLRMPERPRLWLYHKPRGLLCTNHDPQGRPTIFQALPFKHHIISVGRLDLNSEGLLLLTNNGDMARYCELPKTAWQRYYAVRVHGDLDESALHDLINGITIDGIHYGKIQVEITRQGSSNTWLYVTLVEGKNREIRVVLGHLGLSVNRIRRLAYGPFQLGELELGQVSEVPHETFVRHFPFLNKPC